MATITTGTVDTEGVLAAERVVDMDNEIKMLEPEVTQFTTALMKLRSKDAVRERVDWLEDQYMPRLVTLGASADSAQTSLAFSTGDSATLRTNQLIRNQSTGECYRVTGVTSDSATGVKRAIGGVAAASSASGIQCLIIGTAFQQGANIGTHKVTKRTNQYNYTQIFRDSWSFTRTETKIELYGGRHPMKERAKKLVEHKRAIEYALFWGARGQDTSGTHPVGYSGGAFEYISTNIKSAGGTLSASTFDQYLIDLLQFCKDPFLFVSPIFSYNLSQMAAGNYRTNTTGEQKYGFVVDAFISGAYGFQIPVAVKRDWNDFTAPTGANNLGYGGWGFLIDMSRVTLRPLRDSNTKLYTGRQGNDEDSETEEYLTELTLQFEVEKAHGIIKGVQKS